MRATAARLALIGVLGLFYYSAATEHARVVNTSKARGDQSALLWDAQQVYANWHGRTPPSLIGQRFRMPLYAGYLALSYDPSMSDDQFFEVAKRRNIQLSLALLGVIAAIAFRYLSPLVAANFVFVVAFSAFIFKAGYSQPELLAYTLFFCAFVVCCGLLKGDGTASLVMGLAAGGLAALTHLAKAIMLPFGTLFLLVYVGRAAFGRWSGEHTWSSLGRRMATAAVAAICFLALLYPYIANSKRFFGGYFYHGTTSVLTWYDDAGSSLIEVRGHLEPDGRITLPPDRLPSALKYWRSHSVGQIIDRLRLGATDIAAGSFGHYWYLKYATIYAALALAMILANRRAFAQLVRRHLALFLFLIAYGGFYLTFSAFFSPISGTGATRFVLTHLAPFLFVLSVLFTLPPFNATTWTMGRNTLCAAHGHLLVFGVLLLDVTFTIWPRLMTTYGGF